MTEWLERSEGSVSTNIIGKDTWRVQTGWTRLEFKVYKRVVGRRADFLNYGQSVSLEQITKNLFKIFLMVSNSVANDFLKVLQIDRNISNKQIRNVMLIIKISSQFKGKM